MPTTLIAAFRSTLEEVKEADLILHIIDSQDEEYEEHIQVVEGLITQLGAGHIPVVKVFNKSDLPPASSLLRGQKDEYVSSFKSGDMKHLKQRIEQELRELMLPYHLLIPSDKGDLIAKCRQYGFVASEKWDEEKQGYRIELHLPKTHALHETMAGYYIQTPVKEENT